MNKQSKKIPINLPNLQDNFDIKLHLALGVLIVLDGLQQRLCQLSSDCPLETVSVIWRRKPQKLFIS